MGMVLNLNLILLSLIGSTFSIHDIALMKSFLAYYTAAEHTERVLYAVNLDGATDGVVEYLHSLQEGQFCFKLHNIGQDWTNDGENALLFFDDLIDDSADARERIVEASRISKVFVPIERFRSSSDWQGLRLDSQLFFYKIQGEAREQEKLSSAKS